MVTPDNPNNSTERSWDEAKMFVLQELRRMNSLLTKLDDKIDNLNFRVAGIAATVGVLVALVMNFILHKGV